METVLFDRNTRVFIEAETTKKSDPLKGLLAKIFGNAVAWAALGVSLSTTYLSWSTLNGGNEAITITGSRDVKSGIDRISSIGGVAELIRSEYSYSAHWDFYVINTSRSAATPIVDFAVMANDFYGRYGLPLESGNLPETSQIKIQRDGKPLSLPFVIQPGEAIHLRVTAPFNVSALAYPKEPPPGLPPEQHGL